MKGGVLTFIASYGEHEADKEGKEEKKEENYSQSTLTTKPDTRNAKRFADSDDQKTRKRPKTMGNYVETVL